MLGWGVGGIEAEAAMLGQPMSMLIPQVIGLRLSGALPEGATATDLVLTVTELLRAKGVVGRIVEFFGPGLAALPLADLSLIHISTLRRPTMTPRSAGRPASPTTLPHTSSVRPASTTRPSPSAPAPTSSASWTWEAGRPRRSTRRAGRSRSISVRPRREGAARAVRAE